MTFREKYPEAGAEHFERCLLDSALHDELPGNEAKFWGQLSTALNASALLAQPAGAAANGALVQAQRLAAIKWLALGIVIGGTSAALVLSRASREHRTTPVSAIQQPSPVLPPGSGPRLGLPTSPVGEASPSPSVAPVARVRLNRAVSTTNQLARAGASAPLADHGAPLDSSLAAQVELLDAARVAVAAGSLREGLRLADQYRTDFPSGELAPEAEVVAIEALSAGTDRAALTKRAARFLARYPGDPHTERVRWLAR